MSLERLLPFRPSEQKGSRSSGVSPPRCSQCSAPVASSCSGKSSAQGTQTTSRDSDGHIPRDTELLASCSCRALPAAGTPLTRESSFPVAIAIADSRHPVVEKVQQLPQGPCVRNRGETGLQCSTGSSASARGTAGTQPLPGRLLPLPTPVLRGSLGKKAHSSALLLLLHCPSLPLLTWFFTGVT